MSTAYYLLPGARLPKDVAPAVIPRIDRSLLDPILEGLGTPVCQRLAEGLTLPFARCTHHLWFWGVVRVGKRLRLTRPTCGLRITVRRSRRKSGP